MESPFFRILLLISVMATASFGFLQPLKSAQVKYRKATEEPSLTYFKKQILLFPVKSKILCPDAAKCKENQENGIRVKKQLNFDDEARLLEDNREAYNHAGEVEAEELGDYEDLEAAESGGGRWKRSLLGRLFGYPEGHYRRRWWPARRHHHHHRHHFDQY